MRALRRSSAFLVLSTSCQLDRKARLCLPVEVMERTDANFLECRKREIGGESGGRSGRDLDWIETPVFGGLVEEVQGSRARASRWFWDYGLNVLVHGLLSGYR
jgi:hypothetical protein